MGNYVNQQLLPVSLSRSGYPRIIPSFIRHKMYRKDDTSDTLVRIWLSLFSLSRIVLAAKKVDRSIFDPIVSPVTNFDRAYEFVNRVAETLPRLIARYTPWISQLPLHQGLLWEPTCSQLSNQFRADGINRSLANAKSCFNVYPYELSAFVYLMQFVHIRGEQWSQGALWPRFIRFALDQNKKRICVWSFYWFERAVGPYLLVASPEVRKAMARGRLGCLLGKRRIFAIGNYVLVFPRLFFETSS